MQTSILSEVRPPTGEPDAEDPPVRFGGRGSVSLFLPLSKPVKEGFASEPSYSAKIRVI